MVTVPLHTAQAELPELIGRALGGEEILIERDQDGVTRRVRLAPETSLADQHGFDAQTAARRGLGTLKGRIRIDPAVL